MRTVLLVHAKGGPAASYAIDRISAVATVHVLAIGALPAGALAVAESRCASLEDASREQLQGQRLVDRIVGIADRLSADAVMTFSEFAVVAVAEACRRLGLRGAGPEVVRSRDKLIMRQTWDDHGVPGPAFRAVRSLADLYAAWDALAPPFLLKASWGAGSIGQMVVAQRSEIPTVWSRACSAMESAARSKSVELCAGAAAEQFIAEEVIVASTESWYDTPGYGDYLSVEGLVIEGTYHPVCVTGRLPTIDPFTELSNQAPCVLPEPLQRQVEQVARRAVDALGLQTCGTHTELKLRKDGGLCLLESAARLGGAMITREVETVYGIDMIGALVKAHLGEDPGLPTRMEVGRRQRAAASVALIATDSLGRPWRTLPLFDPARIDWSSLVSPGSRAEVVADLTIPPLTPMPRYDAAKGALNFAGLVFLEAPDAQTLLSDTYRVLDGLENTLAGPDLARASIASAGR